MNETQPLSPNGMPPSLAYWIRTACGRAKYQQLAARAGLLARLRLGWFVLIAALRDLGQPLPERDTGSTSRHDDDASVRPEPLRRG